MNSTMKYTMYTRLVLSAVLISLYIGAPGVSAQSRYVPEPGGAWQQRSPRELGFDEQALNKAVAFALENEHAVHKDLRIAILQAFSREPYHGIAGPTRERGGPAGLIIKNGYVAARWGDPDRVDMTFSVTKSYLSTMAGLALDDGLIRDVNDPVHAYVWDETFDGAHNSAITWHHLLNQSSDWSGTLFGIHDWADRPPREGGIDDWRMRPLNEPGTRYAYNDVRVNVLAYSLLHVWRRPLPVVLKERVMDPIGAGTTWRWFGYDNAFVLIDGTMMQSVSGGGHHGGGMFINTWDQARFGLLFARRGNWNGAQLVSENWIDQISRPSAANPAYGYMWWTLQGPTQWPDVPRHVYYAAGFGGNYVIVDEKNDLVVVTRWLDSAALGDFMSQVYRALKP